ncbi:uncharacterized protein LOC107366207 [Tetranychus urticae]|uniref:Uncharacterized protein n=1 Tax=Tetranychus urticae TaxID=32264 RepID=T1KPL1_TETUR|nr:uncharacterized protein LOC107366207 [Tetranychus urticae]
MIKDRCKEIQNVVQKIRIELYCFLYFLATHMIKLPLNQLIFDKLCLNDYRLAADSCESLSDEPDSKVYNQIETSMVNLAIYQHLLSILPSIILTLFLGHWIDLRLDHLRYILALPCIGGAMLNIFLTVQCINFDAEPIDTIYPYIITGFSGIEILVITGAFTFICKTTDSKYRSIRFIILDSISALAFPLANFLSKKLLSQSPWILGQYRNYIGVFLISGTILTFTEFWVLITLLTKKSNSAHSSRRQSRKFSQASAYSYYKSLHDAKARRVTAFSLQFPGPSVRRESLVNQAQARRTSVANILMGFSLMNKPQGQRQSLGTLSEDDLDTRRPSTIAQGVNRNNAPTTDFTLSQVFHYTNVTMTLKSFLRPRVNNGRVQLMCLTVSMIFIFFAINSETMIDQSLTRNIFRWTKTHTDFVTDMKRLGISLASVVVMIILVSLAKLEDLSITMIGACSILISLLVKGFYVDPIGFYLSAMIEIFFGLTLAGFRSLVTRIVYNYETAKVFAIIACFMTLIHPTQIFIFHKLLNTAMQSKPNVLYLCLCLTLLIPIKTIIYVGLTHKQTVNQRKSFCSIQIIPTSHSVRPANVFELPGPKQDERRKSNRF